MNNKNKEIPLTEVLELIEKAPFMTGKQFESMPPTRGIYLISTKENELVYVGKTFPEKLSKNTRAKQHLSGDSCVSSFVRYAEAEGLIPPVPKFYFYHRDEDKKIFDKRNFNRMAVLANFKFKFIECEEYCKIDSCLDGALDYVTTEDHVQKNYEESDGIINGKASCYQSVRFINKPGRKPSDKVLKLNYLWDLAKYVKDTNKVDIKSVNAEYSTIRLYIDNRKDYLNIVTDNPLLPPKINMYFNKGYRTEEGLKNLLLKLDESNLYYRDNEKTISVAFFSDTDPSSTIEFNINQAIETVKQYVYKSL